jgi:23S rRNA (adenine2503-C2)-methyltransferase
MIGPMTQSDSTTRSLPLVMAEPRGRASRPRHLADLSLEERRAYAVELGLPAFRARQVSTHYFDRLVDDPEEMTDLQPPGATRSCRRSCHR